MSTTIEHYANANATIEFKAKRKFGKTPAWIKERQVESYYNSMSEYYSECISELKLPKRFDKTELQTRLISSLKSFLRSDKDFTTLVSRLITNYPTFPFDNKCASEYLIGLKDLTARVATAGYNLNADLSFDALQSNVPFLDFSNLYLGNYTISYFHEYRAKMTEQYFRRNHFLIRERTNLPRRRHALDRYFKKLKPLEALFKDLLKDQLKLWLFIELSNYSNAKDFPQNPNYTLAYEVDQEELRQLRNKHQITIEKIRDRLYDLDPTMFKPTIYKHEPTETLFKNLVLIGANP